MHRIILEKPEVYSLLYKMYVVLADAKDLPPEITKLQSDKRATATLTAIEETIDGYLNRNIRMLRASLLTEYDRQSRLHTHGPFSKDEDLSEHVAFFQNFIFN